MGRRLAFALNALGWFFLLLALVFGSVRDAALDPQIYHDLQMKEGILAEAGISEADLMRLDEMLAAYLAGRQDSLDCRIAVFGQEQNAFNDREIMHMEDCRRLFEPVVDPWLNLFLAAAGAFLALYARHRGGLSRRCYAGGVWLASGLIAAPVIFLALWAAVDFSSAFTFFHKILFTNDLWLLDPATDLLIRICPEGMFANIGLRIAFAAFGILLGMPLLVSLIHRLQQRKRETK